MPNEAHPLDAAVSDCLGKLFTAQFIFDGKTVDEWEEQAEQGKCLEVGWMSNDEGQTYGLSILGVINGFLALENRTLVVVMEDDKPVGVSIRGQTKFNEPI